MENINSSDSFSKYHIGESVGKGAFGKVYKALNTETGDFCAIKQIEKSIISEKQLPAILQEIKLLQTLQHLNIVRFIESHETSKFLYFALEFIEGGSLAKMTKRYGCFQEPLLSRYITPFWMAPEVIQMDMNARSTACDIWSLGCTLLELLTGNPPYWDLGTMPAMFAMVNNPHPPIPANISPDLKGFLLACFVRDINKRPTATQLLEHPWIKQHYDPSFDPKAKSNRLTSLSTYADGYAEENGGGESDDDEHNTSTTSNSSHYQQGETPKELKERIQQLENQKKEMGLTIQKLKVHFLRAMREKKVMKDMISQLVTERDSYMVKLGLTPPPPPAILTAPSSSNTPTRSALEHANEFINNNGHANSSSHNLTDSPQQSSANNAKHSRSSSAPISPPLKIATNSPLPSTTAGASSATSSSSQQHNTKNGRERPVSSILNNDFFHPPQSASSSSLNSDFEDDDGSNSSSPQDFILSPYSDHHNTSTNSHSERKLSNRPIKLSSKFDDESTSNSNFGAYFSSTNLHVYSGGISNQQLNQNQNNNPNVDMYLKTSGGSVCSTSPSPHSIGGSLNVDNCNNNNNNNGSINSLSGMSGLSISGGSNISSSSSSAGNINNNNSIKKKSIPILQKESSQKSLINNINLSTSPSSRKSSQPEPISLTPRKSSITTSPNTPGSGGLLSTSVDLNNLRSSNNSNDDNHHHISSGSNSSGGSGHSSLSRNSNQYTTGGGGDDTVFVPPVESVVVNVQPPRVGDECKVKCGDGWYDAIVDLVSGSTFVVTIKPFNIKQEVSHSDVTLAPLQFPVTTKKKSKFSLFRSSGKT
eukprot:gene3140-3926_t